jgi:hypothetical protein
VIPRNNHLTAIRRREREPSTTSTLDVVLAQSALARDAPKGRSQMGGEAQMSPYISVIISVLALMLSFGSAVLSFRADRRARESVRPYVSTGVHMIPGDMSVSLSNYGAGVAIVTKMSMNRNEI